MEARIEIENPTTGEVVLQRFGNIRKAGDVLDKGFIQSLINNAIMGHEGLKGFEELGDEYLQEVKAVFKNKDFRIRYAGFDKQRYQADLNLPMMCIRYDMVPEVMDDALKVYVYVWTNTFVDEQLSEAGLRGR